MVEGTGKYSGDVYKKTVNICLITALKYLKDCSVVKGKEHSPQSTDQDWWVEITARQTLAQHQGNLWNH